jgi:hypothetical protein
VSSIGSRTVTIEHTSTADEYRVYPLGDIHLGAAACNDALLDQAIARILADEHALWLGMGDYVDAINMRDPRFEAGGLAPWLYTPESMSDIIGAQMDRLLSRLEPIADKCVGLLVGNHEESATKWSEREVGVLLAKGLAAKRKDNARLLLGYAGFVRLSFRHAHAGSSHFRTTGTLTIYAHHGAGASSTPGGKVNRLLKTMEGIESDVVLMGHVHDERHHRRIVQALDARGRVVHREQVGLITGTYLGQSAYAIERGYTPPVLGSPVIRFRPDGRRLAVEFPAAQLDWRVA